MTAKRRRSPKKRVLTGKNAGEKWTVGKKTASRALEKGGKVRQGEGKKEKFPCRETEIGDTTGDEKS